MKPVFELPMFKLEILRFFKKNFRKLSSFDISDFKNGSEPESSFQPPKDGICYYTDWRYGPEAGDAK